MDSRKRCKMDEKLFIRFQKTENGGFGKPISVDRALVLSIVKPPVWGLLSMIARAPSTTGLFSLVLELFRICFFVKCFVI